MKVLITSIGSAGDVNPSIALGRALGQRQHKVVLLANPYFRQQVAAAGLDFLPLGEEAQLRRLKDMAIVLHPRKGHRYLWRELLLPSVPLLVEALEAAVRTEPPEVVVYHQASFGARWVCARHDIPCALAALTPLVWMSCEDGSVHARALVRESPPKWLLRGHMRLARPLLRWTVDRSLNPIRKRYGLPPARDVFFDHVFGCDLNLGLWSSLLRGPMPDDPPNGRICGFTWFDGGHQVEEVDDEVARFLEQGEPPIVFTMGSTAVCVAGNFYEQAAEACRRLGRRGLLLTGSAANVPRRLPAGVRAFGYARFSTVLPRGCATVHHGGIGTTAQALRSGRPMVVIPIVYDAFDNAARARRLGVSVTLKRSRVSAETLADSLRRVLDDPAVVARAGRLGDELAEEDGAAVAAEALENLVTGCGQASAPEKC